MSTTITAKNVDPHRAGAKPTNRTALQQERHVVREESARETEA